MTTIQELEGLKYTEYINIENGLKILQNWDDVLLQLPEKRKNTILEHSKEFDPLIHLKKICKDKKDIIHTTYKFSKNLKNYGRLFAQNSSLQNLPREIRNALAENLYWDVDMKNCHPCILSQYCKKNGIRCEILDEYIKNRDELLTKISTENEVEIDDVKKSFLALINGGGSKISNQFFTDFKKEITIIHKQICALNPDEYKRAKQRKEYNAEGSMLNVLLCKIEHSILMNSVLFLMKKGYNVDVLCFDGFNIRKEPNKEITPELLEELSDFVKKETGYVIKFVEKSMKNVLDLSKYIKPLLDAKENATYYKDKEEFEKTHLKIKHPLMYLTILPDGSIDYQTEEKIKGSYKSKKTTIVDENGKLQKVSFIHTWLNDEHIREYTKMVFEPPPFKNLNDNYNTWKPFSIESVPLPADFDVNTNPYVLKYKNFMYNLFDGVESYINYYDAWTANIIQYPNKRSCVCLVLYSKQEGTGKNMSSCTLELVVGENYTFYVSDPTNQLFSKHSIAELNRLLVILNEVKGKDTYTNTDLFKTRITDSKREIELKGKDVFHTINYSSYILNTNNPKVVNASDKDRRFCIIPCENRKIKDKLYFDDYQKTINENPEAIRCIYEYLKTYDIEKVVPNRIFGADNVKPKSQMYKDLQECNKEKEWDFAENIVNDYKERDEYLSLTYDMLWMKYKAFCNHNNYDINKLSSKSFHYLFTQTVIATLNNDEETKNIIEKTKKGDNRYYVFQIPKLKNYFNKTE